MGSLKVGVTRHFTVMEFKQIVWLGEISVSSHNIILITINHDSKQHPNTDYVRASLIWLATLFVSDLCVII